jgi:hypothetical protein
MSSTRYRAHLKNGVYDFDYKSETPITQATYPELWSQLQANYAFHTVDIHENAPGAPHFYLVIYEHDERAGPRRLVLTKLN